MLYGRHEERAHIASLLAGAREAHSGVLVVRGEIGVGKCALLEDAASQAYEFQLLRSTGVESEIQLPFAGLHQLLQPVLDRLGRLPGPQADALQAAFGLVDTQANQFLLRLGVLGLLAEAAAERPVLCLVADAQWLDHASADVLMFIGRRLQHEPVVLLLSVRDDDTGQFQGSGLPELHLGGLDPQAAGPLLQERVGTIAPQVRDRLVTETEGNPLALHELPATLDNEQLAGREPLPDRLHLTTRLQQAFRRQVRQLPAAAQMLLLVAAAEDTGELATILAAGSRLAIGAEVLEPAEQVGLVRIAEQRLVFRHPLIRSAIYQAATLAGRQAVHEALTEVLVGEQQADRRVWHLAAGTLGPDEQVAAALEASADRAWRRGGPTAAAAALERAAALTPELGAWTRRLGHHRPIPMGGRSPRAGAAAAGPDRTAPANPAVRARIANIRGEIELAAGTPATACTLLLEGAGLLLASDPARATEMLVLATWAALAGNQLDRIHEEIHPAVPRRPGHDDIRVQRVAQSLTAVGLAGSAAARVTRQLAQGHGRWRPPGHRPGRPGDGRCWSPSSPPPTTSPPTSSTQRRWRAAGTGAAARWCCRPIRAARACGGGRSRPGCRWRW
jgi:AAA ATPase-like protein